MPTMY